MVLRLVKERHHAEEYCSDVIMRSTPTRSSRGTRCLANRHTPPSHGVRVREQILDLANLVSPHNRRDAEGVALVLVDRPEFPSLIGGQSLHLGDKILELAASSCRGKADPDEDAEPPPVTNSQTNMSPLSSDIILFLLRQTPFIIPRRRSRLYRPSKSCLACCDFARVDSAASRIEACLAD